MIPVRGYKDKRVAVLGLGRSGLSAALALQAGGASPVVWDDNEPARAAAHDLGLDVQDLSKDRPWVDVVSLILSPGIPHLYPRPHPIVAKAWAMNVVVDNDIGLFFRSYATRDWDMFDNQPQVVCVTGSNGKSTTTALITHILRAAGKPVQMGGNIGRGVLDLNPATDGEVVVMELSSYQTDVARSLTPDIGVFMNLSPDHLDRHGGMGGYYAAKRRLFIEGGPERAIIGVDEIEGRALANEMRQEVVSGDPVIAISTTQKLRGAGWSVFARKGFLAEWRKDRQMASIDLRDIQGLPGAHNHQNACAAYAVCRSLGLSPKVIESALHSFPGLPHRCQVLGAARGITFVNDSKATNVDAAAKSIGAFKNIRLIIGGQPKEGGIADLAPVLGDVKSAYLIGAAAEEFAKQLPDTPHQISGTIEAAVQQAIEDADVGDVVLLAPACASFDQYKNFELRGDAFVAAVAPFLAEGAG
ncbi:UDP-N-acetylmuramoylalanine--D-glutamate ligase [Amylibacter marinus]|uniref:UDP-N-acetylmuramoylalanine--D-glutamate ligase n=1 Tax=Amylibacter marinus TaxID=1475483 RepID=A0ABQ5VUN2_9RHOB|nr:UDP-N-acetylmuramoyl-L-alanine--D-glutamate ligase [Amylibacter marinus]GLQ34874.1 UDP-N-acetylmuramoylalanine--D-glutamate ligase [Amylibacter marinus]